MATATTSKRKNVGLLCYCAGVALKKGVELAFIFR